MTRRVPVALSRSISFAALSLGIALSACRIESSRTTWPSRLGSFYSYGVERGVLHTEVNVREETSELWVDALGPIEFSEDDRGFVLDTPESRIALRDRSANGDRRYSLDASGAEQYVVDGQARSFDQEGRDWVAKCIATLIEQTQFGAERRAERLLRNGGVAAVVQELDRVRDSSARTEYLRTAIGSGQLSASDAAQAVRTAVKLELSESTRVDLSLMAAPIAVEDRELTQALIEAAQPLSSNSNRVRLLDAVLEQRALDADSGRRLVEAAAQISSPSSRTEVLVRALDELPHDEALRTSWLRALGDGSSSHLQQALTALMARDDVTSAELRSVVANTRNVSSSSSRAELLSQLARHPRADGSVRREVLSANAETSSSSASANVLLALLECPELEREELERISDAAQRVSSTSERDRVQRRIIQRLLMDAKVTSSPR